MSPNDAVVLYNTVLTQLMDKHCPYIKKKITKKPMPWLDLELRILRRKRRTAERAWRKDKVDYIDSERSEYLRSDYVKLRDEFSRLEFVKRCAHHKTSLRSSSGDRY